ncbi:hypothetical protein TSAR_003728 [Trichomalopsis sarcophagae]|uniref:Protein phosphatase inhibitor 2 n=1 Tax=Trichomalopsis sarcophagae TaxID=543379 RepID=A0A232EJB5_9HYME|nr:hypothetical protein TSAR_003728 [Trichomalopsis sarcophagae]
MAENLGKRPSKGILKTSSSFDNQETPSRATKETKWDEMNIIATLHPADKDYGHMKIEEPKTPYNFEGAKNDDHLDSSAVASKLEKNIKPKIFEESSEEEEDEETPEEKERRKAFEAKRKGHYREWEAVQLARKKLLEEEDEEEETNNERDEEDEETEKEEDKDDVEKSEDNQRESDKKTANKCVPLSENDTESG